MPRISKRNQATIDAMHTPAEPAEPVEPTESLDEPPAGSDFEGWSDDAQTGDPSGPPDDEAVQLKYLADAPEWAVLPPRNADFANATWMKTGREILALVQEVFRLDEFAQFNPVSYEVRWRRASKPTAKTRTKDPLFVTITVSDPRVMWEAKQHGVEDWPHLLVDLHYQQFEDRRERAPFYVHGDEVKAHLHHALSSYVVENERLIRIDPDVVTFTGTVTRYGDWTRGIEEIRRAMMLPGLE